MRYITRPSSARVLALDDFYGAPHTVEFIKKYAIESQQYPVIRLFAESVIQGIGPKDSASECLAIYYAVVRRTRYTNDPRSVELVKRPEWIIKQIESGRVPSIDCDDYACVLGALLLSIGREVRACTVAFGTPRTYNGETQYSHVFIQVKEPRSNQWITLDPVAAEDTSTMLRRVRALKIWPIA